MRSKRNSRILNIFVAIFMVFGNVLTGITPVLAEAGTVTSAAVPSNAAPVVGDSITVDININITGGSEPDNLLASYTGTLNWDPAVLTYISNSGAPAGFTGAVNPNPSGGIITFNGANINGAAGNTIVLSVTFDVVGPGVSALDLAFSAMSAPVASTVDLLEGIEITDGQVEAEATSAGVVALDGASSSGTGAANATSVTFSHTTGTGADRLMMVGVSWNSGSTSRTISSVTFHYGTTDLPLTEKISQKHSVAANYRYSAIYSLVNPPSGQVGTVTVTFSGAVSNGIVAGAANFTGVDQADALGTALGASSPSNNTTPTVTLTGLTGDELVFDNVFLGGNPPAALAADTGQTEVWNGDLLTVSNTRGASSIEQATGNSVTMSWTAASASMWVIAAVPINPAAAGPTHVLTIATTGSGSGTVTPSVGPHTYPENTVVILEATANTGSTFDGWSGDADCADGSVTMDGDKTCTATFTLNTQTLTIATTGAGSGTVTPSVGAHIYDYGTVVALEASADSGSTFDGWSGNADCTDGSITMDGDKTCTATFSEYVPSPLGLDGAISNGTSAPTNSSISFDHTTGTGSDRLLLIGVSWNCGSTNRTITSATFTPSEGSALNLTETLTQQYNWETNYRYTAIYSLLQPPSGVTGVINITFSGAVSNGIIAGAANFTGFDPTTPLGTAVGAVGTGTSTSGTPNPSVTLTGLNGNELVFDSVFMGASSTSHTMTVGTGQSELWNVLGYSSSSTSFNMRDSASTKLATDVTATMSWTTDGYGTTATRWAIAAVPINPKPAGPVCYLLTLSHIGQGGDPTASPLKSSECLENGQYVAGESITLTSSPATGWQIGSWIGTDGAGLNTLTMPASAHEASVTYTAIEYTLTVTSEHGTIVKNPNQATYHENDVVQLTATAAEGWSFTNWTGDLTSSTNPDSVTIHGNTAVTANYSELLPDCFVLTLSHTGQGGDPTASPLKSSECLANGQYVSGESITLTSSPATGWQIGSWTGTDGVSLNTLTMPASAHEASVIYTAIEYTLTVTSEHGSIIKNPNQDTYHENDVVQLTATAAEGWSFTNWTGDLTSSSNPDSVTIHGNTAVTANYTQITYQVTFDLGSHGTRVGGGTLVQTVAYGSDAIAPSFTVEEGWNFTGWDVDFTNVICNLTVNAQYSQITHLVTFDLGSHGTRSGGGDLVQTVVYGADAIAPTITVESGWTFTGWDQDFTNVTSDLTVNAQYSEIVGVTVTSAATPSDATPDVGDTITVDINIDISEAALGSFTGTLDWDPTILTYSSNSSVLGGFTGAVNTSDSGTGHIIFNGANSSGTTGNTIVLTITFNVVGAGTSELDLGFSAMAAASTFANLLPYLTITDGQVVATALPNHTVTFNANGGLGSMSNQVANVPTALTLNTFTRSGYTFAGWNTVSGGGGTSYADGATYSFIADMTLYAQWTVSPNHTVIFNANGGTGSMNNQVENVPTPLTLNAFTRSGYNFAGWNTAANGSGTAFTDGATYSFNADITLYAQWSTLPNHTVTFNANGGTGSMSNQVANVPTALTLNAFTRSGYSFAGWNTAANGSGTAYTDGATYSFSTDMTIYAQWTALPNHTVTFNANGGTGTMSPQIANVPTALMTNTFTRTGYNFSNWNTAANGSGTTYANGATYSFSVDMTLYAQWTVNPIVTSVATPSDATPEIGDTITVDINIDISGAALGSYTGTLDWNPAVLSYISNSGGLGGFTGAVNTSDTGTGHIVFNGANASGTTGNTIVLTITFNVVGAGTSSLDLEYSSMAAAITFTNLLPYLTTTDGQVVTAALPNHTVIFNANGGTGSMSNQVANVPTALTLNAFTRSGYSFAGWNTAANGSGTAYSNGATYSFSADMTLYAQWTVSPNHTVTFNANGGTGSMSNQVANVPTALTLNAFTRSGYNFAGWNTAANGSGTAYANGATYSFSADITLYAQWSTLPNHTVIFNANGGTGSMSNQVANIPTALTLNAFTRSGYNFAGWNTASGGGGTAYANGATYSFSADLTLYAQWTALPNHIVTFNANGGTGSMSNQVANVPTALTLNAFTRSGYNFAGWNTASGGGGTAYANGATYSFSADITLYAQWTTNPIVTSAATPSDATPDIGDTITVDINIDINGAALGSYTGTLDWNPAILTYSSNSGVLGGFTGAVNTSQTGTGHIVFNGANSSGTTGNTIVLTITFNVVGVGTSALDLEYSSMAAASTFVNLLPNLTITDGQVIAAEPVVTHTVTFDLGSHGTWSGGGALVQIVTDGEDAVEPIFTVETGWVFTGWDIGFTNITSDLTVIAQYNQITHTVTFDLGGHGTRIGGGTLVQTVVYGEDAIAPAITVEEGWIFTGWDIAFTNVTTDLTVYAQYSPKLDQTITFTSTAPIGATVGGATYTPAATASSGLPVTITVDASASLVCSISGGVVSFIGPGTCMLNANQPGDDTYNPAPQIQQSFIVINVYNLYLPLVINSTP